MATKQAEPEKPEKSRVNIKLKARMKKVILIICFITISIISFSTPITIRWTTPNGCEYLIQLDVYYYTGNGGFNGWHGEGTIISLSNTPGCFQGIGSIVFKTDNSVNGDIEIELNDVNICNATLLKFSSKKLEF